MSKIYTAKLKDVAKPIENEGSNPPAQKKARTPKQIAAFEKAKKTRQANLSLKKQDLTPPPEAEIILEEKAKLVVKRKKKPKVVVNPDPPAPTEPVTEPVIDAPVEPVVIVNPKPAARKHKVEEEEPSTKKIKFEEKIVEDDTKPPKWFAAAIHSLRAEMANGEDKKSKKIVAAESKDLAHEKWHDPKVRDRVRKSTADSMNRLYSSIFPSHK